MKTFRDYFLEQDGLASLGQQDLADDHERPEDEQTPNTPPGSEAAPFSSGDDEISLVRKAIRIVLKSGDKYRQRVHDFLHRMSRDIPELQNIVSQLGTDDDKEDDEPKDFEPPEPHAKMVSAPLADVPASGEGSDQS